MSNQTDYPNSALYGLIKHAGYNITSLANALGKSRKQISHYIHNEERLTVEMIKQIAIVLSIQPVAVFSSLK